MKVVCHTCKKRFPGMTIMYTSIQMVEQIDWRKLTHQRSSPKARMTKLTMSECVDFCKKTECFNTTTMKNVQMSIWWRRRHR